MHRFAAALVVLTVAGCGGEEGGGRLSSSQEDSQASFEEKDGRTLTGCLKLWEGPHTGSTRLQNIARTNVISAKVEVVKGKCDVSLASKDGKVYVHYVEKPNVTGDWQQTKESAPRKVALDVVRSANAQGLPDGSLKPGAP